MVMQFIRILRHKVEEMVELILHHLMTNSNDRELIFLWLNPKSMMVSSIWPLRARIYVCYFRMLISPSMKSTRRPMDDGDVIPTSTYRCGVILEV